MDFKEGQPPRRCLFENWERQGKEKEIIIEVQSDIECSLPLLLRLSCSGLGGWRGSWWMGRAGRECFLAERKNLKMKIHVHTHIQKNISLLRCFHCLHLGTFVTVTFVSHLICAAPLAPLSLIPLLLCWGFFLASLLTVPPRPQASLSSLPLLLLFLSFFSAFRVPTLILSLFLFFFSFNFPLSLCHYSCFFCLSFSSPVL